MNGLMPDFCKKIAELSKTMAFTMSDPWVEFWRILKLVRVTASPKDVDRQDNSAPAVPTKSCCNGDSQFISSTGPNPIVLLMGPESPSVWLSWYALFFLL